MRELNEQRKCFFVASEEMTQYNLWQKINYYQKYLRVISANCWRTTDGQRHAIIRLVPKDGRLKVYQPYKKLLNYI